MLCLVSSDTVSLFLLSLLQSPVRSYIGSWYETAAYCDSLHKGLHGKEVCSPMSQQPASCTSLHLFSDIMIHCSQRRHSHWWYSVCMHRYACTDMYVCMYICILQLLIELTLVACWYFGHLKGIFLKLYFSKWCMLTCALFQEVVVSHVGSIKVAGKLSLLWNTQCD